jgi:hypothetical protein
MCFGCEAHKNSLDWFAVSLSLLVSRRNPERLPIFQGGCYDMDEVWQPAKPELPLPVVVANVSGVEETPGGPVPAKGLHLDR